MESLEVMEQLENETYDFIYLDVPYYSGVCDFTLPSGEKGIRHHISKTRNIPIGEVTREDIEQERKIIEQEDLSKYSEYIIKVIENAHRLLKNDGVVAFLCPCNEHTDINYKLILDQYFPSFAVVTIENRISPVSENQANNYNLYFCSKSTNFVLPELKELRPIEEFPENDEFDFYIKKRATLEGMRSPAMIYEWHGITPKGNQSWLYSREEMDKLHSEGRIIVDEDRAWIKYYRKEHPKLISSVWKYTDTTGLFSFIDSQSIERMFTMFVKGGSRILCPYERDGKFSFLADKLGVSWEAVYLPWREDRSLITKIPEGRYEVIEEIRTAGSLIYKNNVVTNIRDIDELKEKLQKLSADVKRIQSSIDIDDDSESSVNIVVDEIHKMITDDMSAYSIARCLPEAQAWIEPFWDKLEPESKFFIPTGLLLYNLYKTNPGFDQAPIMIEYCKALEKELFQKMYFGYINDLINREISVKSAFPEAFTCQATLVFADFLLKCTTINRDNSEEWKFEIGKMARILQSALSKRPREPIIIDFRDYLNRFFDQQFFRERFNDSLHIITELRNACAHPSIINNTAVEEGKELIRQKLLLLLKYYSE